MVTGVTGENGVNAYRIPYMQMDWTVDPGPEQKEDIVTIQLILMEAESVRDPKPLIGNLVKLIVALAKINHGHW